MSSLITTSLTCLSGCLALTFLGLMANEMTRILPNILEDSFPPGGLDAAQFEAMLGERWIPNDSQAVHHPEHDTLADQSWKLD